MGTNDIRDSLNIVTLFEARQENKDVSYFGDEKKVHVELKGSKSGTVTKLAKQYMYVKKLEAQLKSEKATMTTQIKEMIGDFFDAEDSLKTKYVHTVTVSLMMTKDISPSQKKEFNEEGFFDEVAEMLDENVVKQLEELREKYTKVKQVSGRIGSLRDVKMKESVINEGMLDKLKQWSSQIAKKLTSKLPRVDSELNDIAEKYGLV